MTKKLFNCLLIIFLFSIVSCSNDTSKNNIENKPEIYNFNEKLYKLSGKKKEQIKSNTAKYKEIKLLQNILRKRS